jgi:cytochrome c oxidase cbb3-type subunit 2
VSASSVAADYLYDFPVQLGSLRAGPDLANIGVRAPDANWQLQHLYAPKSIRDQFRDAVVQISV